MRTPLDCVSLLVRTSCVRSAKKYALCWLCCALAAFFRSNLAVRPRFCPLGRPPGRPGHRFSRPKQVPSRQFHVWTAARSEQRPTCIKHRKNCVETHTRPIARYSDIAEKSMPRHLKTESLQVAVPDVAPEPARNTPRTFWRRPERSRCAL